MAGHADGAKVPQEGIISSIGGEEGNTDLLHVSGDWNEAAGALREESACAKGLAAAEPGGAGELLDELPQSPDGPLDEGALAELAALEAAEAEAEAVA